MSKRSDVIVAIDPHPLMRIVEHLFAGGTGFQIVARPSKGRDLVRQVGRLHPSLIITNAKFLRQHEFDVLVDAKLVSPRSKLILVTDYLQQFSPLFFTAAADACIEEEDLVRRLLSTAQKLTTIPRHT